MSEAAEIIGSTVTVKETSRSGLSSGCLYKADQNQEFQLNVLWTDGKSGWKINQNAGALGGKLLGADRDQAAAGVMRAEAVQIGDKSSFNPILGGYVLSGDVLLEFSNLVTLREPRSKWEKLARKALSRL